MIYKMIRKDVKVNGRRAAKETIIKEGDEIILYITEAELRDLRSERKPVKARRRFGIAYEDENLLICDKPVGLLTHGDRHEKKDHLANQVIDYLIQKGEYNPRIEKTFTPAPANRIDRNTTGLVVFAKNAHALRKVNELLREKDGIGKVYLAIVSGKVAKELKLTATMKKDEKSNTVRVDRTGADSEEDGKQMETIVSPADYGQKHGKWYTLLEVRILTGRTHQIRAQLADAGYPILGDPKYGKKERGITTQLLHSWKLEFRGNELGILDYMAGTVVCAEPHEEFNKVRNEIFKER